MAVTAQIRSRTGMDVEVMWGDEGFVVVPRRRDAAGPGAAAPGSRRRGRTCSPAARRHVALRHVSAKPPHALCSCRGGVPGDGLRCGSSGLRRLTSWRSHRGSARSRRCSKPIVKSCATTSTCRRSSTRCGGAARTIKLATLDTKAPSPLRHPALQLRRELHLRRRRAAGERRAQALSVDQSQLRELLGDAELRELLDPDALLIERQLQHLDDNAGEDQRRAARSPHSGSAISPRRNCRRGLDGGYGRRSRDARTGSTCRHAADRRRPTLCRR